MSLITLALVLHVFGLAGYTLFTKKLVGQHISKLQLAAIMQTAIFVFSPLLVLLEVLEVNLSMPLGSYALLAGSAIMISGLLILTVNLIDKVEASEFSIFFNLRILTTTLFSAVFLASSPTALQIAGGLLIFAAIVILNVRKHGLQIHPSIGWAVLLAVWFSVHVVLEKYNIDRVGFETYMLVVGTITTTILWIIVTVHTKQSFLSAKQLLQPAMLGLIVTRPLSAWSYVAVVGSINVAVANYISSMSIVLTVIAGVVLFNERDNLVRKAIATSVSILGLTLVFLGNV